MKTFIFLIFLVSSIGTTYAEENHSDPSILIGSWTLDMTPHDTTDDNFAKMKINSIDDDHSFHGEFYRDGVAIQYGQLNSQTDTIYGALISGDNSGNYSSSFYLKDGKLYGTTHAIQRGFLSVWIATKEQ